MNIEYLGTNAIVEAGQSAFTFEVSESPRDFNSYRTSNETFDWTEKHYHVGDWRILPFGSNNDLPKVIRDVVENNYIAPGILKKKTQLLWGKGPKLYKEVFKDGVLVKEWQDDDEIQSWMNKWDAEQYLLSLVVDFNHIEGVFSKFHQRRGGRIGRPFINKLEHVSTAKSRLACDIRKELVKPTHIVETDWSFEMINSILNYKVYPIFDFNNPFKARTSVFYSNMYSFCTDYYTIPDIYGSLEWLRRSTAVPLILKALAKNSINVKYHVVSPQQFWDKAKRQIEENCTKKGVEYRESMLMEYKSQFLKQLAKVLSGAENAGKFWHSVKDFTVEGTNLLEHGWEIKPIDQNIKSFADAQIKISERSDRALSASLGVHGALGNITDSGKSDSGSEQLYALKNYLLTGIDIPEMIVCKALNYAIKANWPEKKLKVGFYHIAPQREEDVSSKDRVKNQV